MSDSSSVRITAFLNGDYVTGGKALVFEQSPSFAIKQLCDKAADKLSVPADKDDSKLISLDLNRVFLKDGAEVTTTEDIMMGDKLYFAAADEEFIGEGSQNSYALLEGIAKKSVLSASSLYANYSEYVKSKSPEFVKGAISKVEDRVGAVAIPLVTRAFQLSTPYVNWADAKLDTAYLQLNTLNQDFVKSEMAKLVNEKLIKPSEVFYEFLVAQWNMLVKRAGDKKVTVQELIDAMKTKLGGDWNEKLVKPIQNFYAAALDELKAITAEQEGKNKLQSAFLNVRAKLESMDTAWVKAIETNFKVKMAQGKLKLTNASDVFYHYLVTQWNMLAKRAGDKKVTAQELVDAMRTKLGSEWNEKLVEPITNFYNTALDEFKLITEEQEGKSKLESAFINVRARLDTTWAKDIEANFKAKISEGKAKLSGAIENVRTPAEAFYQSALSNYKKLGASSDGKVTWEEFQIGMRAKLGELWNSHLVKPAKHLFEGFTQARAAGETDEKTEAADATATDVVVEE